MVQQQRELALVAGAGPGLGRELLETFSAAGYRAVGLSRNPSAQSDDIEILKADLSDPSALSEVLSPLMQEHGAPAIVVHNTAHLVRGSLDELRSQDFADTWRNMVLTAAHLAKATLPQMAARSRGAFLVSGATASLRGGKGFAAFSSAKFGLRGLTQSLAREFQTQGVHVAHVILDGIIDTPESRSLHGLDPARMMRPSEIAQTYLSLANQPNSVWSHEIDLRPMSEVF